MRIAVSLLAVVLLGFPPASLAQQAGTPAKITHVRRSQEFNESVTLPDPHGSLRWVHAKPLR